MCRKLLVNDIGSTVDRHIKNEIVLRIRRKWTVSNLYIDFCRDYLQLVNNSKYLFAGKP